MIAITLPDGNVREYEVNATPLDVAKSISEGLARAVISASFNNQTVDDHAITTDGQLTLHDQEEGKKALASSAHVWLKQFINYVNVKLTIGPAIDNGFYYDLDLGGETISEKDFPTMKRNLERLVETCLSNKISQQADALAHMKLKTTLTRLN